MSTWMPIESAPRTGEDLLLACSSEWGHCQFAVGNWDEDEDCWVSDFRMKGNFTIIPATHWMPLPEPPK